jgi:hypothetical protein
MNEEPRVRKTAEEFPTIEETAYKLNGTLMNLNKQLDKLIQALEYKR